MKWVWVLALAGCTALFRIDHVDEPPVDATGTDTVVGGDAAIDAPPGPRIVFVTSGMYFGNLAAGGLEAADLLCKSEAGSGMLPGKYTAWLSTTSQAAADRMSHLGGPFMLPNGTEVAADWGGFAFPPASSVQHMSPIDVDPLGNVISDIGCNVWTNTNSDGSIASTDPMNDCKDWSDATAQDTGYPLGGTDQFDARFTDNTVCAPLSCAIAARIYCVQQ